MITFQDIETCLLDMQTLLQNTPFGITWKVNTRQRNFLISLKFKSTEVKCMFTSSFTIHKRDKDHFDFFKEYLNMVKEKFTQETYVETYLEDYNRFIEGEHFDWRCVICHKLANSPLTLEQQHIDGQESIFNDSDGSKWLKCDGCMGPYHLNCGANHLDSNLSHGEFLCTFYGCKYLVKKKNK